MLFGNRRAGAKAARRRGAYRPLSEGLEARIALAGTTIDLANIATNPFGVELDGFNQGSHVGFRVAYVGNVDGDQVGYDDFLVSGPDSQGVASQVYLVLGSQDAVTGNVDWRGLTSTQRIGSLQNLGNPNQPNGFNFNGEAFTISDPNPTGATVAAAGDINGDGLADFLIGFPNADGGAGRAYLVYGSRAFGAIHASTPVFNLDAPPTGLNVVTFRYNTPGSFVGAHAGAAETSVFNFFADGSTSVAIGAPDANIGTQAGGAVYVTAGTALNTATTQTIFLDQVGQGTVPGVVFTGANIGDRAGRSLANMASFDGSRNNRGLLGDLVIGAPALQEPANNISGTGNAYVIYGASNLGTFVTTNPNGIRTISLSLVGTGGPVGADFVGQSDATGFAVSSAGDFNNDGLNDVLIGAPAFQAFTGRVFMVYGRAASSTAGRITGTVQLGNLATALPQSVQFVGAGTGAEAGWSVAPVGRKNSLFNPILIGSPGFLNNAGVAYLIPGQASLTGTQQLSSAQADPIAATLITSSAGATGGTATNRLGESVAGSPFPTQRVTIDNDSVGDMIIGADLFSPTTATTGSILNAGTVYALEGTFVPLAIPAVAVNITTQIGVDQPFPPFNISASTPTTMQIFVFSNNTITPPFRPVTDINPASVTVNGVTFSGNQVTIAQDPVDENRDGIPDAIITISPRSALNLQTGTQTFTITGTTLSTSPNAGKTWGGTATINVTGGGGPTPPPVNPVASPIANPFFSLNFPSKFNFVPPLGERLIPTVSSLSRLTWKPIGYRVAYQPFYPQRPFFFRQENFFHPIHQHPLGSRHGDKAGRTSTLGRNVFTRGRFHPGEPQPFTHDFPVIPTFLQAQGLPKGERKIRH